MRQRENDVAALGADVAHQFDEGPVVVNVPQQIGKKNQEGGDTAEPDPGIEEDAALRGQEKTDDDAEAEDGDGIFFLQAESGDHAEPEPIAGTVALDGEDGEIGAAHPEIGFEAVGAEQASVGKILWRYDDGDRAEEQGEAASAELAGDDGGLHYEERRSQRRDETNAAEGVSQDGAVDVDEKRNERGLVNIAPS